MEKPPEVQPTESAVSGMPPTEDSVTMSRRQVLKYSALLGAGIPAARILQRPASPGMSRAVGSAASKVQLRMLQYQTYYQDDNTVWKAYERTQNKVAVT
ncbi:MAG: hypothetical protein JWM85_2850, partial [Acidimicrobiaceae bacterium]|nr:hypothetical protein [Acidimicrobiaceae bacterium]